MIDKIPAGGPRNPADPFPPGAAIRDYTSKLRLSQGAFALEIDGESMTPQFLNGDEVLIEPAWEPHPGEFVAAGNSDGEKTFKKYRPRGIQPDGKELFELAPLNPDFPTYRSDDGKGWYVLGTMAEHTYISPRARRAANRARPERISGTYERLPLFDDGWPKPEDE